MTPPTAPEIKPQRDTAPPEFALLAQAWLYDNGEFIAWLDELVGDGNPIPGEHMEAAGLEAYVAFTEALDTWVTTLIAGRPYDTPLVEWEARDLVDIDEVAEAAEAAASQERW